MADLRKNGRRRRAGLTPAEGTNGRSWWQRWRWRRIGAVALAFFALIAGILGGLVAYASLTLPNIDDIGKHTGTIKIVDRQGRPLAEVGTNNQQRTTVTIDKIAPVLQDATVAAEDRNFFNEGAFDLKRVVKALFVDVILRRPAEGASTITQQLAKQAFFGADAEKSPLRKLREALLANQIAGRYSKSEILQMYLNLTYYGQNAYGVEDASSTYFGKHAKDLTLAEAALLAGLPEAPSANNPNVNPDNAFTRMHYVLIAMVQIGKATQADAQAADPLNVDGSTNPAHQAAILNDLKNGKSPRANQIAPHFVQYVQDQLQQIFADYPSYLGGDLVVTTTLNVDYQNGANTAVAQGVPKIGHNANNGALLMMDPHTGDILAMVGSANFSDNAIAGQYNIVTAKRRPGSSFKPYVYETGFKNGTLKPDSILQDTRAESRNLGGVNDFDGRFQGPITAANGLLGSRNVAAEQAMQIAGVDNVINFAHSLGIQSGIAPNLSSAIGTSALTMLEHTTAYSAFANGGHRVTPRTILKIQDGSGTVLRDFSQDNTDQGVVMSPQQAWSVTQILRRYAAHWHLNFKWDTAGKSGTTDNFVDAWYMTYTPDWVVATWAGHTDGANPAEVPMDQVFGTTMAGDIAVPFVNMLGKPSPFQPVSGALPDCAGGDSPFPNQSGCPTPTPSPTAAPTPTPAPPTAAPTAPPTPCPTPTRTATPPLITPPPLLTPCVPG